ncbi:hypothetical protein ACWDRB_09370 [Nonomuraea sp. NPDC003707]
MRQVVMHTAGDVRVEEREDPVEEGSPSADRFALLAGWAATQGFGSRQRVTAPATQARED